MWWIDLFFVLTIGLFLYLGVPWVFLRYLRLNAARRCRRAKLVALTFDDGPGSRLTPRIFDCLAQAGVHATFFLLTRNAEGRESVIREALSSGHVLGCHGDQHVHHWKSLPWAGIRDIQACWAKVRAITGMDPTRMPFRPPYGGCQGSCRLKV